MDGLEIDQEVKDVFYVMKTKHSYGWIIYKMESTKVVLDTKDADNNRSYDEFMVKLRDSGNPKWAVYDFSYTYENGEKRNKLVFIQWCLDTAPTREKMKCAATKDDMKEALNGCQEFMELKKDEDFYEEMEKNFKE